MTSSCTVRIAKTNAKLRKVQDFTTGIFIDISGSTGSQLSHGKQTVLEAELSICSVTAFDHVVLWDTKANTCADIGGVQPRGGTQPTAIFQNEQTKQAFEKSDVIVFTTDGEISSADVTKFATQTKDNLNKALVICVLVHGRLASPSDINVSVVAPLMMAANVLCLFHDGETFFIIASKGYISQFYPSSDDLSDYSKLNTLNMHELFHNIAIYEHQKLPDGCIPIREDETEIVAIDYNQFLATTEIESIAHLTEDDWKPVIQYGKIGNKLHELRTFVSHMKNRAIQLEMENLKSKFDFKYGTQRDAIIGQIVALKLTEGDHSQELHALRQQLHDISDRAKVEEIEYLKYVNDKLHLARRHWNTIQSFIHEQETGSYSINDFTFASNRASRAKVLNVNDDEHSEAISILDHTNVPVFECAICMEDGPFVLWLKPPGSLTDTTDDFIINFPLEGNDDLAGCLVANPVCGLCAKAYMNASVTHGTALLTLYREPCAGFVPLNWSTETNRKFANFTLFHVLTGNRILHHVPMLLLAMIDDCHSSWLQPAVKDYAIRQIVEHIYTTDSFSEEGTRMLMIDALKEIVQQEDKLLRQPVRAVGRLLHFAEKFHRLDTNTITVLLRKRFALMCIESQCSRSKFGPEHLAGVKQQLYDLIFDTFCGIPLYNSERRIQLDNDDLRDFLGRSYDKFIPLLDRLATSIGVPRSAILPAETIVPVLYVLTTVPAHDRPMRLYTDFALQHGWFRGDMIVDWQRITQAINNAVFGNHHQVPDSRVSSFVINLGKFSCSSKLFFYDEPLWTDAQSHRWIPLSTLMNELRTNLERKMRACFGSATPNQSSGHFILHLLVAEVLEELYPNEDVINDEMIMNCMIRVGRTAGRKGDIYVDTVFPCVVIAVEDYLQFRRATESRLRANDEQLSRSFEYKVLCELLASGMQYNESTREVRFEPERLKPPHVFTVKNDTRDFRLWKERVQQCYVATRRAAAAKQNSVACLTVEIKEFIEFGYKMSADDLLPVWSQEQKNIVRSIVTDRDEIEQPIRFIAGLDISFVKTNDKAVACMIIFDYPTLNIVAKLSVNCNMKIPYIANYLAFREAPVFMKLLDIQQENCPHLTPQVILMDGNGVWHPRRAGIAAHFAVLSGIPCFGISKNVLYADGITRERIEQLLNDKAPGEDQYVEVVGDSGEVLGLAYNVTGFVKNAVYISVGHKITLPTALEVFKTTSKFRICEPIRQADLLSRELVAKLT